MGRPVLAAVEAQQKVIDALRNEVIVLKSQLHYIAKVAGVSPQFEAIRKSADALNPAQPVEEPPAQPPVVTTEEAATPEAYDNVQNPGQTPGSTNNLAADAHDVPMTPGIVPGMDTQPYNQLIDVEAPVQGTQEHVPLDQTKTLTDVRVGDPMNPEIAFPLTPAFQGQSNTGGTGMANTASRTMASIHLARLRVAAKIASGDDLSLGAQIEASNMSNEAIAQEISTLSSVQKAAARSQARPASLVPQKAAAVQRTTPSLAAGEGLSATASLDSDNEDSDLFM